MQLKAAWTEWELLSCLARPKELPMSPCGILSDTSSLLGLSLPFYFKLKIPPCIRMRVNMTGWMDRWVENEPIQVV